MSRTRFIFMKLDGVVITPDTRLDAVEAGRGHHDIPTMFDFDCIKRLGGVIRKYKRHTPVKIVLTSSWRYLPDIQDKLFRMWMKYGMPKPRILPLAKRLEKRTTGQILEDYLEENMQDIERWVVLDSNPSDVEGFREDRTLLIKDGFQDGAC